MYIKLFEQFINNRLLFEGALILKVEDSIKNEIKNILKSENSELFPLPMDKLHVTLTSFANCKPNKQLLSTVLPLDLEIPKIILGDITTATRNDKKSIVIAVKNQDDFKNYVNSIYNKMGLINPEPNRYFHITIANNVENKKLLGFGDPFGSIGNIIEDDFINKSINVYFDLDGVLADMQSGLMQNAELIELRKNLYDLIDDKFIEYKNLVDDDIKGKFKLELENNPNSEVKELKKAFNKYTNKVFSVAARPGFYLGLPLMPGAIEMVKEVNSIINKKSNILSSPVGDENDPNNPAVIEKRAWVAKYFPNLIDNVIITTDKGKIAKNKWDILIDDRPKYINTFKSAGGSTILYKNYQQVIMDLNKLIK